MPTQLSAAEKTKFQKEMLTKAALAIKLIGKKKAAASKKKSASKSKGLTKKERKEVKSIISNRKEFKYCPNWINYDLFDPATYTPFRLPPVTAVITLPNTYNQAWNTVSVVGFQTGHFLNAASTQLDAALTAAGQGPCMNPLGGYGMQKGDTSTTIDGDYAYFHSGQVTLRINSVVASGNQGTVDDSVSPLCFRLLHVKAKKDAAGTTPSLSGDLLRNMENTNKGLMSEMTLREVMDDFPVNRDRFTVVKDLKFKLSEPVQPSYAGNSNQANVHNLQYPTEKIIKLWLDKPKKKLRFSNDAESTISRFEPTNYDFVHYIFLLCSREQLPNGTYSSTQKRWTVTTRGQTKYRDC